MVDSAHWVRSLGEFGRDDLATAGGKGANLGELLRAGVRVPPGFVVTTDAQATAGADGAVPPEVGQAILTAYADLGRGAVAVRSSATAEDLPGAAFAGQQDTFLDVEGEQDLLDAVRRCWASLWSERAVAYRERRGIDDRRVRMAVVVQRMVPAEVAGVAFTANPVTGGRAETVIDAGLGLGEAVVSGTVTADHLVVDRTRPLPTELPGDALARLGSKGVADLVATADRIAAHFDTPQDIEWAYADRTLWIVQARPMTALPPPPLRFNRLQQMYVGMVAELLPVRPFPLDMTTWVVRGHGRILTRMADEIAGLQVDVAAMLPEVDGVVDQLVPVQFRPTWRTFGTPFRLFVRRPARLGNHPLRNHPPSQARAPARPIHAPRTVPEPHRPSVDPARWTEDPRFVAFDRDVNRLRAVAVETLAWRDLLARVDEAFGVLDRFITLRIAYLPAVAARIARLRALLGVLGLSFAYGGLVAGITTRTGDANRALRDLGDDPTALDAYLHEYGHREVTSAFLVSQPTWGEDPGVVRRAAAALAAGPAGRLPEQTASRALAMVEGRRRVRLLRLGPRISSAAAGARSGIAFREDSHFHASRLLPIVRGALLEAGERLARAGVLHRADDVWHLRWTQLTTIADPDALPAAQRDRLRAAVAERTARREAYGGAPLISPASLGPAREAADALVSGSPASTGTATGPVRVVRGPEEFGRLQPGDVLVCPYTNPAWTPLFEVAVAAVVDTGSVGSHAAITAREYGIPAVMGTGRGTTLLPEGQLVTVDGRTGAVRLAHA